MLCKLQSLEKKKHDFLSFKKKCLYDTYPHLSVDKRMHEAIYFKAEVLLFLLICLFRYSYKKIFRKLLKMLEVAVNFLKKILAGKELISVDRLSTLKILCWIYLKYICTIFASYFLSNPDLESFYLKLT